MIWRAFTTSSRSPNTDAWWRTADAVAASPSAAGIDRLAADALPSASHDDAHADEVERQHEMIEGLRTLRHLADLDALPVIATQHRVIGPDVCHLVVPVTLAGQAGAGGTLFVTSARLVLAGGTVTAWPWHRVREFIRRDRDVVVTTSGGGALHVQCNVYGDALTVCHVANRLRGALRHPVDTP